MIIHFKKLRAEATIPSFGHDDPSNAGLDLYLAESRGLGPYESAWLPSGIAWQPDLDDLGVIAAYWKPALLLRPRSSMAKNGLDITEGTIDAGYRGEIMIHIRNMGSERHYLEVGHRIAQVIPILVPQVTVKVADELQGSDRGDQGFGSSGR